MLTFEQGVRLVDEKKEAALDHRLTQLLSDDSLLSEHPQTHVDGFLVEIGNGVVR
ncbi:MAG: hypothetical protein IJ498_08445 [Akkermansia sp.]|nr:hypothetical protein [Akkermansia sp.]